MVKSYFIRIADKGMTGFAYQLRANDRRQL